MDRSRSRHLGSREPQLLPAPEDMRERLAAFYRDRDAADADAFAAGSHKVRSRVYAMSAERLESGEQVFESYGMIAAAGVELPASALKIVESLPNDWSKVCRIDQAGRVWTSSLRAKGTFVR